MQHRGKSGRALLATVAGVAGLFTMTAGADSITPDTVERTLDVGETTEIQKTVTTTTDVTTAKADVFFLSDTTGSMGGLIDTAQSVASNILTNAAGLGDVNFGVGEYEDFSVAGFGGDSDVPFTLHQSMLLG